MTSCQEMMRKCTIITLTFAEQSCGFKPEKVEFDIGSSNKNGVVISIKTNTEVVLVL